jgi:hypothetical protein
VVTAHATCPAGTKLVGGGARTVPLPAGGREGATGTIEASRPNFNATEWIAELLVTSNEQGTIGVQAYALCAK